MSNNLVFRYTMLKPGVRFRPVVTALSPPCRHVMYFRRQKYFILTSSCKKLFIWKDNIPVKILDLYVYDQGASYRVTVLESKTYFAQIYDALKPKKWS